MVENPNVFILRLREVGKRRFPVAFYTAVLANLTPEPSTAVVALYDAFFNLKARKPSGGLALCRFHRCLGIVNVKNEVTYFRFNVYNATKEVFARVGCVYIRLNLPLPGNGYGLVCRKTSFVHQSCKRSGVLHILRVKDETIFVA